MTTKTNDLNDAQDKLACPECGSTRFDSWELAWVRFSVSFNHFGAISFSEKPTDWGDIEDRRTECACCGTEVEYGHGALKVA